MPVGLEKRSQVTFDYRHSVEKIFFCAVNHSIYGSCSSIDRFTIFKKRLTEFRIVVTEIGSDMFFRYNLFEVVILEVHSSAIPDAALIPNRLESGLRYAVSTLTRTEIAVGRDKKIAGSFVAQIFIHVKTVGEEYRHGQKHNRQRERQHGYDRLRAAAAQVCPGQGAGRYPACAAACFPVF